MKKLMVAPGCAAMIALAGCCAAKKSAESIGIINREDLVRSDRLWLETDGSRVKFTAAPRIGIAYASKRDQNSKWRFTLNRAST